MALALCGFVAFEHLLFMVMESFLWTHPTVVKSFGQTAETARIMKPLAFNQGVYNGFLAAGLVWGIWQQCRGGGVPTLTFFLGCVIVAALVGAATAKRSILFVQGGPALLALILVRLAFAG